jgi:hypothetical protein
MILRQLRSRRLSVKQAPRIVFAEHKRAAAERVLDAVPWSRNQLLYARVDMISDGDRDPILMELELTEPQLYFHDVPTAAQRAAAIIEAHARRRQARFSRSEALTAIARRNDRNTNTRSVRPARSGRAS